MFLCVIWPFCFCIKAGREWWYSIRLLIVLSRQRKTNTAAQCSFLMIVVVFGLKSWLTVNSKTVGDTFLTSVRSVCFYGWNDWSWVRSSDGKSIFYLGQLKHLFHGRDLCSIFETHRLESPSARQQHFISQAPAVTSCHWRLEPTSFPSRFVP